MTTGYLQDTAIDRIDHEYGALRLESKHSATRFLPLRLLTRIVAKGAIDWSAQALSACLAADIPIALLGSDGDPVGYITAAKPKNTTFDSLSKSLRHLPADADFAAWHRSRERFSMIKNLNNKRWTLNDLRASTVWAQECLDHQRLRPSFDVGQTDTQMVQLLEIWVYQELTSRSIDNSLMRDSADTIDINLLAALTDSMIWVLRARYGQWYYNANESFNAEIAFENMLTRLSITLRKELSSLQKWIQEVYSKYGH